MTEEQKKQISGFCFGVICELVNRAQLSAGEQAQVIRDKCARKLQIPCLQKTRISRGTIERWVPPLSGLQPESWSRFARRIAATGERAG
jgi:hypothetical protein